MTRKQTTCPACHKAFHPAMKACPFCGADRPLEQRSGPIACPLCQCALEEIASLDEALDICPKCQGLWLDQPELVKLTSERSVLKDESIPHGYQRGPMETRSQYLPCPRCAKFMVRRNFRSISGVIIDLCGDHGAWFDAGELEQVRSFVANGGIDRHQDRELARQDEEIGGLKSKVRDLEMMERILNKWEWKRIRYRGL